MMAIAELINDPMKRESGELLIGSRLFKDAIKRVRATEGVSVC
jgi:hypothetical protein